MFIKYIFVFLMTQSFFMHADTNYIYILLVVLYIIYSIIRAGKKVKKNRPVIDKTSRPSPQASPSQPSPVHSKRERTDELKKLMEDFLGVPAENESTTAEKNFPKPVPQPAKILSRTREKTKPRTVQPAPFLDTDIRKTKKPAETHHHITQKIFSEPAVAEETPSVDFDIRQAIIFSEILKRPQY